jgi:transposase-like protein
MDYRDWEILKVLYMNCRFWYENSKKQDHCFIKKRVRSMLGLKSFRTATYILIDIEAMHMIKKKQIHQGVKSAQNRKEFIAKLLAYFKSPFSIS